MMYSYNALSQKLFVYSKMIILVSMRGRDQK